MRDPFEVIGQYIQAHFRAHIAFSTEDVAQSVDQMPGVGGG